MKTLKDLLIEKKVKIATMPKGNLWPLTNGKIDYSKIESLESLIIYTIEHDYSGISAHMQNYSLCKLGITSVKSLFLIVSKENSKELYRVLKETPNYIGGGAGSGLKDIIGDYLDELEQSAIDLKSVNAIYKKDNKLIGFNTDGLGFRLGLEKLLEEKSQTLEGKKLVVMGAGGVALPIVYELTSLNPSKIIIVNRTISKAESIANYINSIFGENLVEALGEDKINLSISNSSLIVNVSNKGADGPFEDYSAFSKISNNHEIESISNLTEFLEEGIVCDIVLSSKPKTKTLQIAENLGFTIQNGNNMVLYQGVPAFKKILSQTKHSKISHSNLFKYMFDSLK